MYADDMVILAPSVKGLQRLLRLGAKYCLEWDIKLNSKKSKNMSFGKGANPSYQLELNDGRIEWVDNWTYLRVNIVHGQQFGCCIKHTVTVTL